VPDEGFWVVVVLFDEAVYGRFQFFGCAMDAAPQPGFYEQSEPAFHQIQPTGGGGRELGMETGTLGQ
jgi:hypothetical protein